ncbi:MAG: deoxyribonuclease IV [Pseudonocardiaceae bacterium]|nr:deoxyribonuclease IV [Pseudonocardiaceae bacterium]
MRIGAHVRDDEPLAAAAENGADVVQFFVSDPQGWKAPVEHPRAAALRDVSERGVLDVYVHSPYVINVASCNNRIRIPSRKAVAQQTDAAATIGARGLIVHGGHVRQGEDPAEGVENWRKLFERQADRGGFATRILVENTAGGDSAMARRFDALARLWDAIGDFDVGFCLDTCHAHAAGEDLPGIVDRVRAITGRIDLLHCNNSRDEFGSSRDRHAPIHEGTIAAEQLVEICATVDAPVVLETRPDSQADDIAYLRTQLDS